MSWNRLLLLLHAALLCRLQTLGKCYFIFMPHFSFQAMPLICLPSLSVQYRWQWITWKIAWETKSPWVSSTYVVLQDPFFFNHFIKTIVRKEGFYVPQCWYVSRRANGQHSGPPIFTTWLPTSKLRDIVLSLRGPSGWEDDGMMEADGKAQNGDQDRLAPRSQNWDELVLLYSLSPSTTAQLMAAV